MSRPLDRAAARAPRLRVARIVLIVVGVLLIGLGAVVMQQTVAPKRIFGVALWLAAALVLHDAIIAPLVFGVGFLLRKVGRRIPVAVLAIVQGGIVVASVFSLIVLPEIYAKHLGPRNPTVLPFDYGARLVALWAAVALATALAVVGYGLVARRQKQRPPIAQD